MLRSAVFRTLKIVALFVCAANAYAQQPFEIRFNKSVLGTDCKSFLSASIQNVTDSSDVKKLEIGCSSQLSLPLTQSIQIPGFDRLVLATDWELAKQWKMAYADEWLTLSNITLPNQSYQLTVQQIDLSQTPTPPRTLLSQDFIVDKTQGPSISTFTVTEKSFLETLKDKYVGRQAAYVSIIVFLSGLLVAAIKKRVAQAVDRILDGLGAYGKGQLAIRRFQRRYTDYLLQSHKYLRLIGFVSAGINRPLLEEVFVSLRVSPFDRRRADRPPEVETGISFETAIKQFHRLVILGGPGAGKTTILSYVVMQCVNKTASRRFGFPSAQLPIYVPLRRLSKNDTSLLDDILSAETQILPADILRECPKGYIHRQLERGNCILLLDGLDEVTDDATHKLAANKINRIAADYKKNRFIVTCRIAGWQSLLDEFRVLEAQDLSRNEVHRFVFGWHRAVITQDYRSQTELKYKDADERASAWESEKPEVQNAIDKNSRLLLNALEGSARLMAVAKNPMLLSLICLVHYVKNILPRERPTLYEKCIELLIDAWDRTRNITATTTVIDSYHKEAILRAVALSFQSLGKGEAPRSDVERMIEQEGAKIGVNMPGKELLREIELRSGILVERSIDVIGFSHLTLQEYLVAKHLQLNANDVALLTNSFDNQEWREVTLLYAGMIDDATALVQLIIKEDSLPRWLLAGYTLGEARRCQQEVTGKILPRLMRHFVEAAAAPSEILLNVLSAVSVDYQSAPATPEETLSAQLVEVVQQRTASAPYAIRVLGKARVQKALPQIVECLAEDGESPLRSEATQAVIGFGNIAIPHLTLELRKWDGKHSVEAVIQVLCEIDTAEAAALLVECYQYWPAQSDQVSISLALATMLSNEAVESDLPALLDRGLPAAVGRTFQDTDTSWPSKDGVGRGAARLSLKIRDDIAGALTDAAKFSDRISKASFKLVFPALVRFLRSTDASLSREQWQSFGFSPELDTDLTILQRIHKGLKSGHSLVNKSVQRLIGAGTSASDVSRAVKLAQVPCQIVISLLFGIDGAISTFAIGIMIAVGFFVTEMDTNEKLVALIVASAAFRFWFFEIWAIRLAGPGQRLKGFFNAFPIILRRTPYLTSIRPWINFLLLQVGFVTFSSAAVIAALALSDTHDIPSALIATYVAFLASTTWFYKYVALNVDDAALLVLQHPAGRKLLGISEESFVVGTIHRHETAQTITSLGLSQGTPRS
jgi:hypothetical protein